MNTIIDDKEELFDVYKEHFAEWGIPEKALKKDFNSFIFNKTAYMPYWFVVELMVRGYDIVDQEEDF